jgi:phosphatidylinositol alpha-1,6-mannosyltransferase
VVTLSRLKEEYKNVRTVIGAWKHLPEEITNERELVIAGDGPRRESLEEAARDSKNIRFVGYIDEEAKRDLLSSAAVFVFVPKGDMYRAEGFGIVYIEAQASGTPVVGSLNGGAPEAVGDGGIVVNDESDSEEVADAVRRLIIDEQMRSNSLSAIERRIDRFGINSVASDHVANYI